MMRYLIESSLKLRYLLVALALGLTFLGLAKVGDTPTDLLPEFSPPIVEIQTEALGLSAAEVEQLITVPLEADLLNGVAWLDTIRSESIPSLSSIELQFLPGTDIMAARHMVQEKLTQAHGLPNVSKPPVMLQPLSSTSRVLQIGLSSKELSLIEMSVLARWNIRPRLMGVAGVANVSIWGQRKRQLQVLVEPERLKAEGVTLSNVVATAGNALWMSPLSFLTASAPGTGGFIDTPNQRLGVRHVLPIVSPEGLANVMVEGSDKRLGDVTQVVESHQPLIGDALVGNDVGIMLVVEKFPWANTLEVTRAVEKAINDLRPGLKGIELDTEIYRPAGFIELALKNLNLAILIGGLLAIAGLLLYCRNWRATLISVAAVTVSVLLAWFVFFITGATMDLLVLAGLMIAIGAVVDASLVNVENVRRRLAEARPEGTGKAEIITKAALEVGGVKTFATLMILLLVVPFFTLEGVTGTFLSTVGSSYAIAVVAAFVATTTLTPALAMLLLPKAAGAASDTPATLPGGTVAGYPNAKALALGISALALVVFFAGQSWIYHKSMIPEFHETDLLIQWDAKPGTSQPEMSRITAELARELSEVPGVRNVGAHVGRAITSDRTVGIHASELWLSIDPTADYQATLDSIEQVVKGYPGMDEDVSTYPLERIEEVMGDEDDKVVVRVYGQESDVLSLQAQKVKDVMSNVAGVTEIEIIQTPIEPTIEIRVDLERAKQYGIKPGDVRRAAATLLSGLEVGSLFEEKKVFDVMVWSTPETRASLSDVRNLLIQAPNGTYVRLAEVAEVAVKPHPTVLKREGVARYVDVEIDIYGRSKAEVAKEVGERLAAYSFPMEYHAVVRGDYAKHDTLYQQQLLVLAGVMIGIFLLLQAAFRSWRLAAVTFLSLPVAALGGIALLFVTGVTLGSFVGLITVIGLALRWATFQVVHYQRLERIHGIAFGVELVARGTRERAKSIVGSAVITALVVLPFALYSSSPGLEIIGPMALVILAGLITALVFALFILPTLYLAFGEGATSAEDFEDLQEEVAHA